MAGQSLEGVKGGQILGGVKGGQILGRVKAAQIRLKAKSEGHILAPTKWTIALRLSLARLKHLIPVIALKIIEDIRHQTACLDLNQVHTSCRAILRQNHDRRADKLGASLVSSFEVEVGTTVFSQRLVNLEVARTLTPQTAGTQCAPR